MAHSPMLNNVQSPVVGPASAQVEPTSLFYIYDKRLAL